MTFFGIKSKLSIYFYSHVLGFGKTKNSIIKCKFLVNINYELNNLTKLLLITEFGHNNVKNA